MLTETLSHFSTLDLIAVLTLLVGWTGLTLLVENSPDRLPSTSRLMADYRRDWMREFVTRQPRIFDAQIIGNLRQGTAFFASATMIAIGGGLALLGNADLLRGLASDLTDQSDPVIVFEIKLAVLLIFAVNAFLKFVWAHRLFGYCAVVMSSVPNDTSAKAYARADKAATLNITAARGYNRGLRSVYFGISAAAWLVGAILLIVASLITIMVIFRREFWSQSREALLLAEPDADQTGA